MLDNHDYGWNKMIDNKTMEERRNEFEKSRQKKKAEASYLKARSKRKNKNKKK
jgi:hypothetical protein